MIRQVLFRKRCRSPLFWEVPMMPLEEKITLFHQIWQTLSDFEKNDWREEFRIRFTCDSTSLDGSPLTLLDVKMVLIDGIIPMEMRVPDYESVRGHDRAWNFVRGRAKAGIPLTEGLIKDLHRLVVPLAKTAGTYREQAARIRGSQAAFPAGEDIGRLMKDLINRMDRDEISNPLEKAVRLHGEFSKIQPFLSGNGKTARLLTNYTLLERGYPPISIKSSHQEAYFQALEAYVVKGDELPLYQFLKGCMEERLDEFIAMYGKSYRDFFGTSCKEGAP